MDFTQLRQDANNVKKCTMSFANSLTYKPEHPERTARRSLLDDVTFQEWPSRKAMAISIRMQESGPISRYNWKAVIPLTDGE